jgi:hypothetical protein
MFSELEEQRVVRAIANAERGNRGEVQVRVERRCAGDALTRAKALYKLAGLEGTEGRHRACCSTSRVESRVSAVYCGAGVHTRSEASFWQGVSDRVAAGYRTRQAGGRHLRRARPHRRPAAHAAAGPRRRGQRATRHAAHVRRRMTGAASDDRARRADARRVSVRGLRRAGVVRRTWGGMARAGRGRAARSARARHVPLLRGGERPRACAPAQAAGARASRGAAARGAAQAACACSRPWPRSRCWCCWVSPAPTRTRSCATCTPRWSARAAQVENVRERQVATVARLASGRGQRGTRGRAERRREPRAHRARALRRGGGRLQRGGRERVGGPVRDGVTACPSARRSRTRHTGEPHAHTTSRGHSPSSHGSRCCLVGLLLGSVASAGARQWSCPSSTPP